MLNAITTALLWNFAFAYLLVVAIISISLASCGCRRKELKSEQRAEHSSGLDTWNKTDGKKKSKADKEKMKKGGKQSKKDALKAESQAKKGEKGETKADSKQESEAKTDDADGTDKQKEKAIPGISESIEALDEPRKFLPETPEEQEAYKKIVQGKMRAAKDNETVEDAVSDWGEVQKVEGMPRKERGRRKEHFMEGH
ncbi:hypothetical protein Tcan_04780 [Toxocara canis]|nr:hypothetical protein Tcan_04780 [Toxocara canis]